jgi:polyhydroxybutyrate depolymerase
MLSVTAPQTGALTNESLVVDGVARTWLKYTPAALPAGAVPLVIVLHGGTEDGAAAASASRATARWKNIADLEGFIVAYPDGLGGNWNDCRSDATVISRGDDIAFIDALITRNASDRPIDTTRVYVTGASNGGLMAYRVAQELATRVAGIGAVIANLPVDPLGSCRPGGRATAVVIMNGTADPLMPYAGGTVASSASRGTVQSSIATRDYWAGVNGCAGAPSSQSLADTDPGDGSTVVRQTYASCTGAPLVYFRVDGGGHNMPSRAYPSGVGSQNRDIEGADEIWLVLRNYRR